jgi:hypothetical protein
LEGSTLFFFPQAAGWLIRGLSFFIIHTNQHNPVVDDKKAWSHVIYLLDLRPEGAILFTEVVEVGLISGKIQHYDEDINWFGFHVTTSEGLRLECATSIKLQVSSFCIQEESVSFPQVGLKH